MAPTAQQLRSGAMWLEVADPDGGPSEAKSAMHHINWPEGPTVDQRSDGVKRRRRRGRGIGIESFVRLFYCSSLSSAAADDAAAAGVWLAGPGHWCGKAEVRPPSGLSFGLVCAIITSLPEPSQQPASQPATHSARPQVFNMFVVAPLYHRRSLDGSGTDLTSTVSFPGCPCRRLTHAAHDFFFSTFLSARSSH
ncbi:hypothetical protein AXG93_1783s1200 [Marchantia polymorpha subsp. ruderalis]|uniref:Uncharacterized protein n=1 Tax=Marchantia polymorpha subsp. ruderalis TaxID=1480154 RepID=A0A176VC17_MARPO|nr:hypothetical protein AXG93_1783s1200 [Marchantia polymorpha subsp. ruderalis]